MGSGLTGKFSHETNCKNLKKVEFGPFGPSRGRGAKVERGDVLFGRGGQVEPPNTPGGISGFGCYLCLG